MAVFGRNNWTAFSIYSAHVELGLTVDVYLVLLHKLSQMRETLSGYNALHIRG